MSESLKSKRLILMLVAGVLLTCSTLMPFVNAQPTPTSLTIAVTSRRARFRPLTRIPFSSECTIEATLKDENGNPLQNFLIDFLYECGDHTHLLGSAETDSNGVVSLTHTFEYSPYYDPWRIMANFSGTTSYAQSSSEYVDIIVIDYTPYLVGGGIIAAVAIIGVAGYFVFYRRKKAS